MCCFRLPFRAALHAAERVHALLRLLLRFGAPHRPGGPAAWPMPRTAETRGSRQNGGHVLGLPCWHGVNSILGASRSFALETTWLSGLRHLDNVLLDLTTGEAGAGPWARSYAPHASRRIAAKEHFCAPPPSHLKQLVRTANLLSMLRRLPCFRSVPAHGFCLLAGGGHLLDGMLPPRLLVSTCESYHE